MGCLESFKSTYKTLSDTTLHLMKKVPEGKEDFTIPGEKAMTMGQLLYHLGDCQRFLHMILEGKFRDLDKNFLEYMGSHPSASRDEAIVYFQDNNKKVMEILDKMIEKEFLEEKRYFWTVNDEPLSFIAFNVIEHNASHKYQLFMYLKIMGLPGMDSFALAGEDTLPREEILKMYVAAHKAYDDSH